MTAQFYHFLCVLADDTRSTESTAMWDFDPEGLTPNGYVFLQTSFSPQRDWEHRAYLLPMVPQAGHILVEYEAGNKTHVVFEMARETRFSDTLC